MSLPLSGLHAPNAGLTSEDYRIVRLMASPSVKLMATAGTQHTPADLLALRTFGVPDFTVRVRDTREPDGRYPGAQEYVDAVVPTVRVFYALGVRRFQVDNEPNHPGMWDQQGFGPWQYQYFMRHVVGLLRAVLPPDVILVSPPLSFSSALWGLGGGNPTPYTLDDWFAAFHWTDGGSKPNLWRIFSEAGANVYWLSERQMRDTSYGLAYEQIHARSGGMRVCVCEYANSATRDYGPGGVPRWTLQQVNEARRQQYPVWLGEAQESGEVSRAYLYIAPGSTPDWADFRVTDAVAAAVATAADAGTMARGQGHGQGLV